MTPLRIQAAEVQPQTWRNGGGFTRELLVWPNAEQWQLRISLANIEANGPFSAFPGVQRGFAVVRGGGVVLRFPKVEHSMTANTSPIWFDGGEPPDCQLIQGASQDLNLMVRNGHGLMQIIRPGLDWHDAPPQRGIFTAVAGTWRDSMGGALSVPPLTLLWWVHAPPGSFSFKPDTPTTFPAGWWLGFTAENSAL